MSELRENACSVPFQWWKVLLSTFETGAHGPTVFPPRKNQRMRTKFGTGGVIRIGCRKVAPRRRPPYHFIWPNSLVLVPASLYNMNKIYPLYPHFSVLPDPSLTLQQKKLFWLFLSPHFSFSILLLWEFSCVLTLFEYSSVLELLVGCVNGGQPLVLGSKSDSLMWNPKQLTQFGSPGSPNSSETRDKVLRGFPGGPIVTLSPLISLSLIDLFKGLPMCYPRLPVGPGLLTGVGVGSRKSSNLVWQVQPFRCLCLSVTVLCNSRWKKTKYVVWGFMSDHGWSVLYVPA